MLNRFLLPLIFVAILAPLRAQDDGPVKMTPEFPLVFPLTKNGDDVTVKFPVMINPTTVLKPGTILRTLYIINFNEEGSSDLVLAHAGNMEQAYSRQAPGTATQDAMPAELSHELEGYRRTVWNVPNNFVLAMAQYPTDVMHLISQQTKDNRKLDDARFSFFDGLFVGLPDGKVTVLAVENESKADAAGIKAGDEILAVGGVSTNHDLNAFASAYASARKIAKEDEATSYTMTVRSDGESGSHVVNVSMPPTIKSELMSGFDDEPPPAQKPSAPATNMP